MPKFESPISGLERYTSKILRIKEAVYTTDPNVTDIQHIELAKVHGVLEIIELLARQEPDEVDGGLLELIGTTIVIGGFAATLDIPVTEKARDITVERIKQLSPGYEVYSS